MAANAFVRARIDEDLKNQAADVLAGMGLTISDLVRITLTKVAREKALPFDLREPNQLTIQSIKNSEAGVDVHKAKDADDLFDKLTIIIFCSSPEPTFIKNIFFERRILILSNCDDSIYSFVSSIIFL